MKNQKDILSPEVLWEKGFDAGRKKTLQECVEVLEKMKENDNGASYRLAIWEAQQKIAELKEIIN